MKIEDQIAAVRREIVMRRSVYPRWVLQKRMTQEKADHEIAAMEAVLDTMVWLEELMDGYNATTLRELGSRIDENTDGG